jgi:hypothetical protein
MSAPALVAWSQELLDILSQALGAQGKKRVMLET